MKNCPFCAEKIQEKAIVCRFCGKELPTTSPVQGIVQDYNNLHKFSPGKIRKLSIISFVLGIIEILLVLPISIFAFGIGSSLIGDHVPNNKFLVFLNFLLVNFCLNVPLWLSIIFGLKSIQRVDENGKKKWQVFAILGLIIDLIILGFIVYYLFRGSGEFIIMMN